MYILVKDICLKVNGYNRVLTIFPFGLKTEISCIIFFNYVGQRSIFMNISFNNF
jgi:hypothetical protein